MESYSVIATQPSDLDGLYAPCLPFHGSASEQELSVRHRSLVILDQVTAPVLKAYLESASTLGIIGVIHKATPLLWVIGEHGELRFALEEVVNINTGEVNFALPRNGPPLRVGEVRLGHPALLDPIPYPGKKAARIGGEIFYDPVEGRADWVLSNNSGRFGKRPHINRGHLENVRSLFLKSGIEIRCHFVPYVE
ncbi:hypothetical protein LAV84_07020 [Rhizobium sp. VS19-DR104.2]|uniref:hypothetical protein n=1 Tax=unclassified Rhizobium TaxID=2613769 RepID=UPI001CC75EE0|nr:MULTISPECIES: hypothetical protein [unclassified Rhizobium]MBZ5760299.1 hypothetical protein [Rhizobium sp. VS19-DR96]MBZ5766857.1 hypothetical protein [Rhizobium sp. VS19-DR129.2]MBZ5773150.1 hypothetical protein [Rhizobium sp. VS19-DRK62.2]MBZ5784134.1 hypothetical protein [Rhizobium sp. VS19-DR121]MBZ5802494.1 hypothetical protein [Rhizobium sp. VS19-DR181]